MRSAYAGSEDQEVWVSGSNGAPSFTQQDDQIDVMAAAQPWSIRLPSEYLTGNDTEGYCASKSPNI